MRGVEWPSATTCGSFVKPVLLKAKKPQFVGKVEFGV